MTGSQVTVPTPYGEGRLTLHRARTSTATLVLSHGAGGGIEARDLAALAEHLPPHGFSVALFEQPWRVAGRRIATPPATLDVGLTAAVAALRSSEVLVVGGRSAGARSAARCATDVGASGCLALAFPLHPPGKPEKTRILELRATRVPTLLIQGERDAMGRPEAFPADVELCVVPGADHGFKVAARGPVTQEEALGIIVESTLEWLVREVTGNQDGA